MSKVYAVPGMEHRLDVPDGAKFKTKISQRPLSPPPFFSTKLLMKFSMPT
jgi:hypothetical protein